MISYTPRTSPSLLAVLSVSVLALGACQSATTSAAKPGPQTTKTATGTVDSALERAMAEAESNGNKQESLALLEQIYKRNASDPAVAVRFARALREDEQLNRARLVLSPHIHDGQANSDILTEMSLVQLGLGQYKDAETFARRAVETDPDNGRSFLALGTALDALGYYPQAEVAFRRGLERWKGDPAPILNNLALNLASQGNIDESLAVLDRARKLSPGRMEIERNYRIISTLNETSAGPASAAGLQAMTAPVPARKPQSPVSLVTSSPSEAAPSEKEVQEVAPSAAASEQKAGDTTSKSKANFNFNQ